MGKVEAVTILSFLDCIYRIHVSTMLSTIHLSFKL